MSEMNPLPETSANKKFSSRLLPKPLSWQAARKAVSADRTFCKNTARLAVRSLYAELVLFPKPGLVSLVDNGSHTDMTADTFMRSLFSLRHYFIQITQAGFDDAPFATLKRLGIEAEKRMLQATGGINTHRGAIFCLGMLCAAIGRCRAQRCNMTPQAIRAVLLIQWGDELHRHMHALDSDSHGQQVAKRHAVSGAREEVAQGLPGVFDVALPMLRQTIGAGRSWNDACVDALFSLMTHISDTNVYYRGGAEGARTVKRSAQKFLSDGGTAHPDWRNRALQCHRIFIERKLSPGGAADLLAATCLVHQVTRFFL